MTHANDGNVGTDAAVFANGDVRDRGVQDKAVAVDEGGGRNVQTEAVIDVYGAFDVGDTRTGGGGGNLGIAIGLCNNIFRFA